MSNVYSTIHAVSSLFGCCRPGACLATCSPWGSIVWCSPGLAISVICGTLGRFTQMMEASFYAGWALGVLVDKVILLMHCPIEWSDPVHASINEDGKFTGSAPSQEYLGWATAATVVRVGTQGFAANVLLQSPALVRGRRRSKDRDGRVNVGNDLNPVCRTRTWTRSSSLTDK